MKNILHIISSPRGAESVSIKLGRAITEKLLAEYPGSAVREINLADNPFPHMEGPFIASLRGTGGDAGLLERSDEALRDVMEADVLVIGIPLFNFGIPSNLKSWLDNILRPGLAFRYGANGPEGLITGKKVYIAMASGGVFSEGPMQSYDFATPYLKAVLAFIGITDITIIRAEGMALPALKETALEHAMESITV